MDEKISIRLQSSGIPCEVFADFFDAQIDRICWEKAYELYNKWRTMLSSLSKFSDFDKDIIDYYSVENDFLPIVQFHKLRQELARQGYDLLIFILNGNFNHIFPTINMYRIETKIRGYTLRGLIERIVTREKTGNLVKHALVYLKNVLESKRFSAKKISTSKIHTLFVITGIETNINFYANPALSIMASLSERGITSEAIVDHSELRKIFQNKKIKCTIVPPLPIQKAVSSCYRLNKIGNGLTSLTKSSSNFDMLQLMILKNLLNKLPHTYYHVYQCYSFFEALFKIHKPDVVCTIPDGSILGKVAVDVTRRHGVPTLTTLAGIINDHPRYGHLFADKVAVSGEAERSIYMNRGVEPERIVVTGFAHFDHIFKRNKRNDSEKLSEYGINKKKKIVVFATQGLPMRESEQMLKGVLEAVLELSDVLLVIKVHPREDAEFYKKNVEKYPEQRVKVLKDVDLYALLNNCDLLITQYSTVALEAMLADKPVMVINLSGKPDVIPYAQEKAALGIYQYKDISSATKKALYSKEIQETLRKGRSKFIYKHAYRADGKASERIANLMEEMAHQKRK